MPAREFTEEDRSTLRNIYSETKHQTFHWQSADSLKMDDFDKDTEGEKIWVYQLAEEIVGFISIWQPENFIHHLFVLPEYARRGYGAQLLATSMVSMNHPITLKCSSQNANALAFYRSKGWRTVAKGIGTDGEYHLMQADYRL
ncbi:MAG: GNAT family N-acetyltransferase [Oceanicoccus sp.]